MKKETSLCLCLLIAFSFLLLPSLSYSLSVPAAGQQTFTYPAVVSPEMSGTPSLANPLGVGNVASGGDILGIQVMFNQFDGPVDIYLAVYIPSLSSDVWMIRPDQSLVPLSSDFPKWKEGVSAAVDESILGNIPVNLLPDGDYYLGVLVSPTGSLNNYYFWITNFNLYQGSSVYSLLQGMWHYNINETVWVGPDAGTLPQYGASYAVINGNNWTTYLIKNGILDETISVNFTVSGSTLVCTGDFYGTAPFILSNNNKKFSVDIGGGETIVYDR